MGKREMWGGSLMDEVCMDSLVCVLVSSCLSLVAGLGLVDGRWILNPRAQAY